MLCKDTNDDIIDINNNSNNAHNDESINYWHEMLESTKEENRPHPNIWPNIQHFKK
jgi:hypothetical protein